MSLPQIDSARIVAEDTDPRYPALHSPWIDSVIASLSLRQRVGQMIVPFTYSQNTERVRANLRSLIERHGIGGVIVSLGSAKDAASLIDSLQSFSRVPLLISADFESGAGGRLKDATEFPSCMALGATRNTLLAYRMGLAVAAESHALGVQQNYAPVADVNNNPKNPVINTRSYGESPALVASMANAFINGLHAGRMISTVKHFPGHGDTDTDSHNDVPVLSFDRARLDSVELAPFRSTAENGVMSVMLGHIAVTQIEPDARVAATLSIAIVDSLLRHEIKFGGLVVTDALNMKGVTKNFTTAEIAVRAVRAGADVLLMPVDEDRAIDAVAAAAMRGELDTIAIERSVRRILAAKQWCGLDTLSRSATQKDRSVVGSDAHQALAEEIARASITVIRNEQKILPIKSPVSKRHVAFAFLQNGDASQAKLFFSELERRGLDLRTEVIGKQLSHGEIRRMLRATRRADEIILAAFMKVHTGSGTISFSDDQRFLLDKLAKGKKRVVFVSFGSPYSCSEYPKAKAIVCAYSDAVASVRACTDVLFGDASPRGSLPVTIPSIASFGTSLTFPAHHVTTKEAERLVEANDPMRRVDALIEQQIEDHAFPGAVLFVSTDGVRRYAKAYGRHTYDPASTKMTTETIFDLASVSKVISTTSCAMKLYEEGKLALDSTVASYLPEFGVNGKERVTIRNLLLHNSGLTPFRSYYTFCKNAQQLLDTLFREGLDYPTGTKTLYSDLGMITLAKVMEKITGMPLDEFAHHTFFQPMNLTRTMYAPPESLRAACAPTEIDSYWRKRTVQGTVHDETAAVLDGVAGHAGLFSTAPDVAAILQMLLNGGEYHGKRYLKPETIALFTKRQSRGSSRALGWDTPSASGSSAGKYFSASSFGHTGFTGTSVWVDPVKKLFVVFFTNRVHPTRENKKLISFRSVLHDAVMEALMR